MDSLRTSPVTSYVSRQALRRLAGAGPGHAEAAVLFADISGFTRLSETLAEQGGAGLDSLTQTLKRCFGGLLEAIRGHGGDVIQFAGDALLVVWSRDEYDLPLEELALHALACARQMQRSWQAVRAQSSATLSLKIGIGAGPVAQLSLPAELAREAVLIGEGVYQALAAEACAAPGEIIVHGTLATLLPGQLSLEARAGDFARLQDLKREVLSLKAGEPTTIASEELLPLSVRARVEAGQASWLAELRQVTVLFVRLAGPETGAAELQRNLDAALPALLDLVARYEGQLNKLSLDGKGLAAVIAFGLPPLFHEDNASRGLRAALELRALLTGFGLEPAIGVACGRVFCGEVGSAWRREYTMIGDAANTAARLMQAAGQAHAVLCDAPSMRQAGRNLHFETLASLQLKGKQDALAVYAPIGEQDAETAPVRLAGRSQELQQLLNCLHGFVASKRPRLVLIEGESGLGKTSLLQLFRQVQITGTGPRLLCGGADPVERLTPYHAWQGIVRQLLGLAPGETPDAEALAATLGADAVPLLNPILRCDLAETAASGRLLGEARVEATCALVAELIRQAAPLVLILEDAHWLDSASRRLLEYLLGRDLPLLLLVSLRPGSSGTGNLAEYEHFLATLRAKADPVLSLGRLGREDVAQLLRLKLQVSRLPEGLSELVFHQAEGHPFFSEELAYALREAGKLAIEGPACRLTVPAEQLRALELPGTVEGLILSRVDRLAASEQLALKVASVIGRLFEVRVLTEVYPVVSERPALAATLGRLEAQGLTEALRMHPERAYSFRHNLTHQAVYRVLLPTQRQDLHRRVARWYESGFRDELPPYFGLLAHHWAEAQDAGKSLLYARKAGRHALENGLYQEALYFFEQARARIEGDPDPGLCRDLGEACYGLGRLDESRRHLEAAMAGMGMPVPDEAHLKPELGRQVRRQLLHRLYTLREAEPLRQGRLRQAGLILERLGQIYYLNNEKLRGLANALTILNLCEKAGPSPQLARANANLALIAGFMGLQGVARAYRRKALGLAERFEDPGSLAWARQLTAMAAIGQAGWGEACDSLAAALELYERVHDSRHRNECLGLLALVRFLEGKWTESEALSRQSLELARSRADRDLETRALLALGKLALYRRRFDDAREPLAAALSLQAGRGPQLQLQAQALLLRIEQGEAAAARREAIAALQAQNRETITAFDLEGLSALAEYDLQRGESAALEPLARFARRFPIGRPRLLIFTGCRQALQGKGSAAAKSWHKAVREAERLAMPYEAGLARQLLAQGSPSFPLLGPGPA